MKAQRTPIASAVALLLMGAAWPTWAQQAPAPAAAASAPRSGPQQLDTVNVTGIRGALEQSLKIKRDADSHIDVITAEDIGKMPDKNVADSLARVPGVTISSASANEGGFDENDRVSMRGTNPSLTLTLINGHNVASGDWFVLNQVGLVGRSVSYSLLPSELVGRVEVHKSPQAYLPEGGVAGTIDIITRKPLDFRKPLTIEAQIGAVHATLPKETDPQISALVAWKNEQNTMGIMVQAFSEKRHLRRDGQEILGYSQISATSKIVTGQTGGVAGTQSGPHPDLAGVYYPGLLGSAFFEQERKRDGGLIDIQIQPSSGMSFDLSAFTSKLKASNYNRNFLLWGSSIIGADQAPENGYVVRNNTLVSANFPNRGTAAAPINYGVYDQISRPDESSESNFVNLDGRFRVSDALTLFGKLGTSQGKGNTPTQDVAEWNIPNTGAMWGLNGLGRAADWSLPGGDPSNPAGTPLGQQLGWIFGDQNVHVKDKENWAQVDGDYTLPSGMLTVIKFGLRYQDHKRESQNVIGQGPGPGAFTPANWPVGYLNYPGNFGSGLDGNFPKNVWYYTPQQLADFNARFANRDPITREDWNSEYKLKEKNSAAYIQGNLEGAGWSGNVGLRFVRTQETVTSNFAADPTTPGAITTSAFGPFIPVTTEHTYTDVLPSANLKLDLRRDLVARFSVSKTMTRPDYSALAAPVALTPPPAGGVGSGSGGNPDLKPVRSTNFDATLEWYFAPRALASVSAFYMDLTSYVGFGTVRKSYMTFSSSTPQGALVPYDLTIPVNTSGKVKGIELAYEQPLFGNFGVGANYTYADGHESNGGPLVGTSRNTYNLSGYYEDDRFNARLAYTYRSKFYSGLDRNTAYSQDGIGSLSASLGYKINENFSVTFDAHNLNDPTLKYFSLNEDQPRAFYKNGRQYYLNARFKF
jgi:iron complex outermembrane receptor protein